MFKHNFLLIILAGIALSSNAQSHKGVRYKDIIFSDVTLDEDLSYNPNGPAQDKKSWLFDIYQSKNDTAQNRPLIIWMHGGGFKFDTKEAKGVALWSKTFAQRGYVCASINYSLSKESTLFKFDKLMEATYYAVQDAKMAVMYFKEHYKEYHINPDKIILAGNSAGGIIAVQTAYSTNIELAKMAGLPDTVAGAKDPELFKVAGVINLWGGIFDLEWMKNTHVPIVNILGNRDNVVPPSHKSAPLYGGIAIHTQADELHTPNKLKIFEGYAHELQRHFNPIFPAGKPTQKRWLEAGQFAADFLYTNVIESN